MDNRYVLGIDTSNYKTSLAVVNGNEIICDLRKFLEVRKGERGLRQSEALFQHVRNFPEMFTELAEIFNEKLSAIAYSSKPRPVENSYMPCFIAGKSQAVSMGAMLDIPVFGFSHQEGHIEAIRRMTFPGSSNFLACHFSGGTCEILKVSYDPERTPMYRTECIGGTKDISFGQVLDRAGVAMGMDFPCGSEMDEIATGTSESADMLTPIKVKNAEVNLSGIDTQIKNLLQGELQGEVNKSLIREIFEKISEAAAKMLVQASAASGLTDIVMSGGVSSSRFMRAAVDKKLKNAGINARFDESGLSSDNAVGTAWLGESALWD